MDAAHGARHEAELVRLERERLPRRAGVERGRAQGCTVLRVTLLREDEDEQRCTARPALVLLFEQRASLRERVGLARGDEQPGLEVARGRGPACGFEQRRDLLGGEGPVGDGAARPALDELRIDFGIGRAREWGRGELEA
jgi:hypothetical protein